MIGTSADREQFQIAVVLETDGAIGKASGKVSPHADLETKLFVVVSGLSEVTNSDTDMIDAPSVPDKSLSGRLGIVRAWERCDLSRQYDGREKEPRKICVDRHIPSVW